MRETVTLLDCELLLSAKPWPTRKIAERFKTRALARGGGLRGAVLSASETEHFAFVMVPPSMRDWAQHFEGWGVSVLMRMPT